MSRPDLVSHLARFGRALRERGAAVTLSDEADGLLALTLVDLGDRGEVRRALKVALKIRPRDFAAFEELFERLWSAREEPQAQARQLPRHQAPGLARPVALPAAWRDGGSGDVGTQPQGGDEPGYSPEAVLRRKSFDALRRRSAGHGAPPLPPGPAPRYPPQPAARAHTGPR